MSYDAPPPPPPPPGGYGYGAQPPYGMPPQDHPKAQTAMILGILGIVCCSILAIPAYIIGNNAVQEIDRSGGQLGGRGMANAGKIMGIIGIVLMIAGIVLYAGLFAVGVSLS